MMPSYITNGRKRQAFSALIPEGELRRQKKSERSEEYETTVDGSPIDPLLCWFCQQGLSVVAVQVPHPRFPRRKKITRNLCLRHYYTTPAARTDMSGDKNVQVLDQEELDVQLKPMQELFAEAFCQLQQEITQEAARAFNEQQNDPLAILHNLHKKSRIRKPLVAKKNAGAASAGGFLRDIPLPERLVRTQERQAQIQRDLTRRMETSAAAAKREKNEQHEDFSKRRKSSRKSIWNVIMEEKQNKSKPPPKESSNHNQNGAICTCGSHEVETLGTNTSRNQDLKKGETWGMKDRGDEVLTRLQCQTCGRTWNEDL